jgi:hypothetical protein
MTEVYKSYEWFLKQDLSGYAGKWLAIIDNKVVASGENAAKVIQQANKDYPKKKPFITKVRAKLSILFKD